MFSAEELRSLDPRYFVIIIADPYDVTIMSRNSRGVSVDVVCEQMSRTPPWVPGLILNAAGFEAEHYKKD